MSMNIAKTSRPFGTVIRIRTACLDGESYEAFFRGHFPRMDIQKIRQVMKACEQGYKLERIRDTSGVSTQTASKFRNLYQSLTTGIALNEGFGYASVTTWETVDKIIRILAVNSLQITAEK